MPWTYQRVKVRVQKSRRCQRPSKEQATLSENQSTLHYNVHVSLPWLPLENSSEKQDPYMVIGARSGAFFSAKRCFNKHAWGWSLLFRAFCPLAGYQKCKANNSGQVTYFCTNMLLQQKAEQMLKIYALNIPEGKSQGAKVTLQRNSQLLERITLEVPACRIYPGSFCHKDANDSMDGQEMTKMGCRSTSQSYGYSLTSYQPSCNNADALRTAKFPGFNCRHAWRKSSGKPLRYTPASGQPNHPASTGISATVLSQPAIPRVSLPCARHAQVNSETSLRPG